MKKIKAMLIEEILFLIFVIITGLMCMEYATGDSVFFSMKWLSILIVTGKGIEAFLDHTILRKVDLTKRIERFLRMLVCFVVINAAYFSIIYYRFFRDADIVLLSVLAIFSSMLAFLHLFISTKTDKVLNYYDTQPKDMIFHCFEPIDDDDEEQ